MRRLVLFALLGACTGDDLPRFDDKGQGVWVEAPNTLALTYRAVWGVHARDVFAVGDGAVHFDGTAWTSYELPAATYRAIWGRSGDQIWIGGDNILLARTLSGWQEQLVFDGAQPITEFSVLSIAGDGESEYAVIRTGAQLLLVINRGSAWETPYWRSGETLPFGPRPSLHAGPWRLRVAGDGVLHTVERTGELGAYESVPYFYDGGEDITIVGGTTTAYEEEWVAVGPDHLLFTFGIEEAIEVRESRDLAVPRKPRAVAMRNGRAIVVGERVERVRTTSGIAASQIEACDVDGCALERIEEDRAQPLDAVWTDGHSAIAVGDGFIVHRTACGALRCEVD